MELAEPGELAGFLRAVRSFGRELAQSADGMERSASIPREVLRRCGELGLAGMLVPCEHGGSGVGEIGYVLAIEEISRASASLGVVLSVHNSVGVLPTLQFGTAAQVAEHLPRLCSGEHLAGFAITEAGAGSDVSSVSTSAARRGGGFVLNGTKLFISNGEGELINVLAQTGTGGGRAGQTLFIVRRGDRGFRVAATERKMGIHADTTCELVFEDCFLPGDRVLGQPGEGFKAAMVALDAGRIGIGAQSVGAARGALEAALEQVRRGGKAYPSSARSALAECATELEAAWLLVLKAADRKSRGLAATASASMAKLLASTVANRIGSRLVSVLGPGALVAGHPAERLFRDSKVFEIYEGTSEIHQLIISRRLLGSWSFEKGLD